MNFETGSYSQLKTPSLSTRLGQSPNAQNEPIALYLDALAGAELVAGQSVLLSGVVYTMRDAGHRRCLDYLEEHGDLPFGLKGQSLFYAGPTELRPDYAVQGIPPFAAVGPTTASRMDFAAPALYRAGIAATIGKGHRSAEVCAVCREFGCAYFAAVGGAAALLATKVISAELVAWPDLGPEALYKLEIVDFPALIAIDGKGRDIYG
ncbi:MAG: FumA C-terminus/TtdB family hydratase beta subunit [Coriobacteriales bacterium]|jgi:tartrate/fumarate subfamily iron-sulfur-dependent hydro-lyase beta chain|nr:FumA C-terminus/TtdB family hydratase beta subunit [Coriobacteriales bacterium]